MCNLFLLRNDKALRIHQPIHNKKFGKLSEVSSENVLHDPDKVICNFSSHKLTEIEKQWHSDCPHDFFPKIYRRYVHEIFVTFNLHEQLKKLESMNKKHPNLKP